MSVKLVENKKESLVCPKDMKDGQIGVIVEWPGTGYIGTVVQAYEDCLISVGEYSLKRWSHRSDQNRSCLIRLLEPGETIEVISND